MTSPSSKVSVPSPQRSPPTTRPSKVAGTPALSSALGVVGGGDGGRQPAQDRPVFGAHHPRDAAAVGGGAGAPLASVRAPPPAEPAPWRRPHHHRPDHTPPSASVCVPSPQKRPPSHEPSYEPPPLSVFDGCAAGAPSAVTVSLNWYGLSELRTGWPTAM